MIEKSVRYPLSFSARDLPKGLFVEMNFSKVLANLKMAFSIAFNLLSKLGSCAVAAANIARAGFILIILDAEEIAAVVLVEEEVRVTKMLLLVMLLEPLHDYS